MATKRKSAKLILETGQEFRGELFGASRSSAGEVVFNTGMTGFELSLTDPSYRGQILAFTFPLVGNFGIPAEDRDQQGILKYFESENIHVRAVIISNLSEDFSHYQAIKSWEEWLIEKDIPGITGLDTRALTEHLREKGTVLGQIVPEGEEVQDRLEHPEKTNLVAEVSIADLKIYEPPNPTGKTVLAIDTGIKNNILRCFLRRGIRVILAPWDYQLESTTIKHQGKSYQINGLFLANGPGDPKMIASKVKPNIEFARDQDLPLFGICLGNQLVNLALGGDTYKLPYGHRGVNQPCQDVFTGRSYVTSQNHGFVVDENQLPPDFELWLKNLNDGSTEGIRHKSKPIFSVQFHPEACPGPQDTEFLFDQFIKVI